MLIEYLYHKSIGARGGGGGGGGGGRSSQEPTNLLSRQLFCFGHSVSTWRSICALTGMNRMSRLAI